MESDNSYDPWMDDPLEHVPSVRLDKAGLEREVLRRKCKKGHGLIYYIKPMFATSSNGYIGRTEVSGWKRLQGHKTPNSECPGLRNAIAKHGLSMFTWYLLKSHVPVDKLAYWEREFIATYDTHRNGYNCTAGGEAPPLLEPAVVAKVRATKATAASKAKTSKSSRLYWNSGSQSVVEHKAKLASMMQTKGRRDKKSKDSLRLWKDPEYVAKISGALKAKWADPEYKKRREAITAAQKAKWADPDYKKKRSQAIRNGIAKRKTART